MEAAGPPQLRASESFAAGPLGQRIPTVELRNERIAAVVLWGYLFVLIAGLAMARSASAALFLYCHGPRELGAVYALVAVVVASLAFGLARLARSIGHAPVGLLTVAVASAGVLFARLFAPAPDVHRVAPFYLGLYVAVESFAFLAPLQFWTLANSLFDWAGARRWYTLITTGGIVGSMAGGALIRLLNLGEPLDLLWPLAVLTAPVGLSIFVLGRLRPRMPRVRNGEAIRYDRPHDSSIGASLMDPSKRSKRAGAVCRGLSMKLGVLTLLTVSTTTLVDYYFKLFADLQFDGNTDRLTQFFGNYYLAVGAATLALQMLITPATLRYEVPFVGLVLMPLALGAATITNLLAPTLLAALVLKLVDSSFSHSVQRSCREMLYTAIPSNLAAGVQTVADGIWGRMGLLGCGIVLVLVGPSVSLSLWLGAICVSVVLWVVALGVVQRAYQTQIPHGRFVPPHTSWQTVRNTSTKA